MKSADYKVKGSEFIIDNYHNSKAFASFLPGISGPWGKPLWAYYVNRGQAITCFGVKDKDGAILEFIAANKAYRQTALQGFRTFLKVDGQFYEPFQHDHCSSNIQQKMYITSDALKLTDFNKKYGIESTIEYFTLPGEKFPALMRRLTLKNTTSKSISLECIDGLPSIIPYGTNNDMLKHISRLAEGWYNGVFLSDKYNVPVYKLPVEPCDRPEIIPIESAHFYVGFTAQDSKASLSKYIIDPNNLFGEIYDFSHPVVFSNSKNFKIDPELTGKNKTPSGMGYMKATLKSGGEFVYYSAVGHAHNYKDVDNFVAKLVSKDYFSKKVQENHNTIVSLMNSIVTKSSNEAFDNYCTQTYLDNILRGGYPVALGSKDNPAHYSIYSRIHGDMEREYNNFVILPEYFSQGNGSYRDVNQNRRNDVYFSPEIKESSIVMFMNLIQLDGFNPLRILGSSFDVKTAQPILAAFNKQLHACLREYFNEPFTLGAFFNFLEHKRIKPFVSFAKLLELIVENSDKIENAAHVEGYWSDHWHYNIDLIETYLSIYPEKANELMYGQKVFTFYDNPNVVMPRSEKYVMVDGQPRQFDAVCLNKEKHAQIMRRKKNRDKVRKKYGKGEILHTTLFCKLLSLVANKYAALDPEGIGVEMESNKPNWCDALNGLPGIFGSSTAESLELKRLIQFLLQSLKSFDVAQKTVSIPEEIYEFVVSLYKTTKINYRSNFKFWDAAHSLMEKFRAKTMFGVSGNENKCAVSELISILELFLTKVSRGVEKAMDKESGVIYTNIEYVPTKYKVVMKKGSVQKNWMGNETVEILKFKRHDFPFFLEGPVHYLRTGVSKKEAKSLNAGVLKSGLYDRKLKMLKSNASLKGVDYNIGRITVFTPGWLENESIWLHMEYKYLFELLRNGLCSEFFKLSSTALVPFMDPNVYGRSIFENSSFLVSDGHPEKNIHGRGYVARLTGSTAEFLSIWIAITSGLKPFSIEDGKLMLKFKPAIPGDWFTKSKDSCEVYGNQNRKEQISLPKNSFLFKFLGHTTVIYSNPGRKNTYGKDAAKVSKIKMTYNSGKVFDIKGDSIIGKHAEKVREGRVKLIEITLK